MSGRLHQCSQRWYSHQALVFREQACVGAMQCTRDLELGEPVSEIGCRPLISMVLWKQLHTAEKHSHSVMQVTTHDLEFLVGALL